MQGGGGYGYTPGPSKFNYNQPQQNSYNYNRPPPNDYSQNYPQTAAIGVTAPQSANNQVGFGNAFSYKGGAANNNYNKNLPVAQTVPPAHGRSGAGNGAKIGVGIAIVVVVIVVIAAVAASSSKSSSSVEFKQFPNEVRRGDNYVGLFILSDMPTEAFDAFVEAADRWSGIVGQTSFPSFQFGSICNVANFDSTQTFDHLTIGASIVPIDGVNGILGSAGPCLVFNNGFSAMGNMQFDSADIDSMISDGSLTSVILHEMGHVLGIGTLWDGDGFLQDSTADNGIVVTNQPKFTGPIGTAKYQAVTGATTAFIPVENGFTNGVRNSAGSGSVDGHWDQDFMPGELMIFVLSSNNPPLSSITIASLQDLGYIVDFSSADAFSATNSLVSPNLRGSDEVAWTRYMWNDTFATPPIIIEPL